MTTFYNWNNSNGGLFTTAQNWSPTGVPNSGSSDADLPTLSQAYTVTSDLNETLDFLDVDPARHAIDHRRHVLARFHRQSIFQYV